MLTDDLKELTKDNHQLLEKKLIGRMRLMRTEQDYINLLSIFYSYFGGLEQFIDGNLSSEEIPDYSERRKANALAADIEALGGILPQFAAQKFLPEINSSSAAFGVLYVMEGSTLGGKIISQMLVKQLGMDKGLSFFQSYGNNTQQMWETFKSQLNAANLSNDEVIAVANETFLKFADWMDSND